VVALPLVQWGICAGIALSLVVVEEVIKAFVRRTRASAPTIAEPADAVA
jgi:hypothetical protein